MAFETFWLLALMGIVFAPLFGMLYACYHKRLQENYLGSLDD